MRHVALISSCLLLWPSLCVGWPPLDDALASQGAKTNQLTQPVELEFTPRGDATNWVGGNSTRKAIVRAVNTETFGRAKVVKLDGEGINFWFEATYKEKLPPLPDVLKAKSIGALDKIFGKRTNWGDGYDAGGSAQQILLLHSSAKRNTSRISCRNRDGWLGKGPTTSLDSIL